MTVFNRRNAAIGWVTWLVGKRVVKKKAKGAVPALDPEGGTNRRPSIAAVAGGCAHNIKRRCE